MPTISTQHLQLNPQNLQQLNGLDPTWFVQARDWRNRANTLDQTTLEDAMRAAQHERAMDPLRLEKQRVDIDSTIASTGLTKSKTAQQDMENEVYGATKDNRIKTEGRKLLMEASDADLKVLENQVYTALQSRDPKERQTAQAILPHLKFAVQERFKTDQQLRVQGAANANAKSMQEARFKHEKEMEDVRIAAGKYDRKKTVVDVATALLKAKSAKEKAEILETAYFATKDIDPEQAEVYKSRAIEARQRAAEDAANDAANAAKIDTPGYTGMPRAAGPTATAPIGGEANPTTASRPDRQTLQGIPDGAIEMLKKNPALAEAFDAKYGKGKAQFILGK